MSEALFSNPPLSYALLAIDDAGTIVGLAAYSFLWPALDVLGEGFDPAAPIDPSATTGAAGIEEVSGTRHREMQHAGPVR